MPRPDPVDPTIDEHGDESHPAWGVVRVSRPHAGGIPMFDSEILHSDFVTLEVGPATRQRDLNRDWIHGGSRKHIEIRMSMAQWGELVSSFGNGSGVPCTVERLQGARLPEVPHDPRLGLSMDEAVTAADRHFDRIREAMDAYSEKRSAANLRALQSAIRNTEANVKFASESLAEHAEAVVAKARADVEAMVDSAARAVGIDPTAVAIDAATERRARLELEP